ncbi:GPI mannosyltransferase 3 [Lutzomyia longipalpis]|uniref:Mannosyltransferase n=1 Tax=Lutzomyia longipalpis TaxID=7200 RepID=A0A1B0C863_LUTLO|nr:GPI mannosyltransferase 3 [Lutzomyia longipalpis]XP_055690678.1 GPI mannosyltransferase 3 [Lutzomyia longipalpis]
MKGVVVFLILLAVRLLSVFFVKTSYVPDEFWQSLEVAHRIVYGYGYLTWEWTQGIRSYVHPIIFAGIYKVLSIFGVDCVFALTLLPRILQAFITAYADWRFFKWCNQSKWSLFVVITSWFLFYTGSRTIVNTVEASLTTIALSFFPWHGESVRFLWYVALLAFIRPTSAVPWIPLCLHHIRHSRIPFLPLIFKHYLPIGVVVGALGTGIDYLGHGSLIFTPLRFFKLNVLQNIGSFYGSQPWYWYFVTGLPLVLGIGTLPFLLSVADTFKNLSTAGSRRKILLISIATTLAVFSAIPHKEFRFILPILPMCLYLIADSLSRWSRKASSTLIWTVVVALLVGNALPAGYLGLYHQKGTTEVMPVLAKIAREYKTADGERANILFLMPCHSTPLYSHIHANVTLRFLTCEPNLTDDPNYEEEAETFYRNPSSWLDSHVPAYPLSEMPSHVVLFDSLKPQIGTFLSNYHEVQSIHHAHYLLTDRIGKNVLVYERNDQKTGSTQQTSQQAKKKPKKEIPSEENIDARDGEL